MSGKIYSHIDKIPSGSASRKVTEGCLVLEGGAFRGLYSQGFMDAMMKAGINMQCTIGVSAGAMAGMNYVAGQIGRSARVNLRYRHDSRYVGIQAVRHNKGLIGFDFVFDGLKESDPFDGKRFFEPERRFVAVATNCLTGETEYFEKGHCTNIFHAIRASASMPYISKMVDIDGKPYLDGGCSCKIPYQWAIDQGFEKIVVIKTRHADYRKNLKKASETSLAHRIYHTHPEFAHVLEQSDAAYNHQCDELEQLAKEGRIYLVSPSVPMRISRLEKDMEKLGHLYALFTILVWGSCCVLTKVKLTAYTPTQIIPLRMGLAYLTLWALRPRTLKLPWKDELMFILIGITGGSVYFFLQNTAAAHTSAANVSILVSMSPILTVILAQLFSRKGEKLGKLVYIGALVAIVGVVLVVLNGTLSFHLSPLGDLLALAAALMWAVYSILVKKYTERYDNFLVTRRVFLWAFLTSLPLVLLTDGMPSLSPLFSQPKILISWLFLGVFGNAVCFAIWNIAFKRLGVVVTNNYLYASPFVTVVVGWLLLGEKISWMSILGAVLITLGVIFANKDGSQS